MKNITNKGVEMLNLLINRANRLFINITDEFKLVFKDGIYCLADKNHPECHILEVALITGNKLSGNKLEDLCLMLSTSKKWILGFFHGYKNKTTLFQNKDYLIGYYFGLKMNKEVQNNAVVTTI